MLRIQARSFFTFANQRLPTLCSKNQILYGNEEGHGTKNEVRKEKWIKKQNKRSNGLKWRMENGFEADNCNKLMDKINTWTDVDSGLSGPPTERQRILRLRNMRLAQDIFDAAMLVQKAKELK